MATLFVLRYASQRPILTVGHYMSAKNRCRKLCFELAAWISIDLRDRPAVGKLIWEWLETSNVTKGAGIFTGNGRIRDIL
jgi:hypothetical protein